MKKGRRGKRGKRGWVTTVPVELLDKEISFDGTLLGNMYSSSDECGVGMGDDGCRFCFVVFGIRRCIRRA